MGRLQTPLYLNKRWKKTSWIINIVLAGRQQKSFRLPSLPLWTDASHHISNHLIVSWFLFNGLLQAAGLWLVFWKSWYWCGNRDMLWNPACVVASRLTKGLQTRLGSYVCHVTLSSHPDALISCRDTQGTRTQRDHLFGQEKSDWCTTATMLTDVWSVACGGNIIHICVSIHPSIHHQCYVWVEYYHHYYCHSIGALPQLHDGAMPAQWP